MLCTAFNHDIISFSCFPFRKLRWLRHLKPSSQDALKALWMALKGKSPNFLKPLTTLNPLLSFFILKPHMFFLSALGVTWSSCRPRETSTIIPSTHSLHSPSQTLARTTPRSGIKKKLNPAPVWSSSLKLELFSTGKNSWMTLLLHPHSVSPWSQTPAPCWSMVWPLA